MVRENRRMSHVENWLAEAIWGLMFTIMKYTIYILLLMTFSSGCTGAVFDAISADTDAHAASVPTSTNDTNESGDSAVDVPSDVSSDTDSDTPTTDTMSDSGDSPTDTGLLNFGLLGYAAYPALGVETTTGGEGDLHPITVTSVDEFRIAINEKGEEPRIIMVEGRLSSPDVGRILMQRISDISIIGKGDGAELDGVGLSLLEVSNVIIRNLKIHHVETDDKDAIRIWNGSHHIWIDHCEFQNAGPLIKDNYDGLVDITHAADYITISWSWFHDNLQGMLVGHSDDNAEEDEGTLHISYHHNRIQRVGAGAPVVRFGSIHIWNNQYIDILDSSIEYVTGLGVIARVGSCVTVEESIFQNVDYPIVTDFSGETDLRGAVNLRNNAYNDSVEVHTSPTCYPDIPYEYESSLVGLDNLDSVLNAGVGVGKVTFESQPKEGFGF